MPAPLLLTCQDLSKAHGARTLFRGISLTISERERIGLIGPNGAGKSTLLQIVAGLAPPDEGAVIPRKGLRFGYVEQESRFDPDKTLQQIADEIAVPESLSETERVARVAATFGRAGFNDLSVRAGALSGGWKKRLAIACELFREPELLILDEPTNHLDLEGIVWLESLLKASRFASLTVSHDRYFLENVATAMLEINRVYPGGLFRAEGNYSAFLEKKDEFLHAQARQQEALENKVRREIEWLRRGAKARTTKSKARIDAAGELMAELQDVNARMAARSTSIDFSATGRRTKRLLEADGITKELGGKTLFNGLSFVLAPGVRLGLLGPNGSGKTTILRMLAGELQPDAGEIRRADNVRVVYFDQERERLDPAVSLRRALAPEADSVLYRDRAIHVAGWAARFGFSAEQLDLAVGRLSGGEHARLLIARLVLEPADVLLLDEPTNDLDIPALEVLEDSLLDFPGAVMLVTHDRYLLDRVSSAIVGLDGAGSAAAFADCEQWERWLAEQRAQNRRSVPAEKETRSRALTPLRKLSYLDAREYEQIERRIEAAETRLREAEAAMQNPEGSADTAIVQARYDELAAAQAEVDRLFARWAELEEMLQ